MQAEHQLEQYLQYQGPGSKVTGLSKPNLVEIDILSMLHIRLQEAATNTRPAQDLQGQVHMSEVKGHGKVNNKLVQDIDPTNTSVKLKTIVQFFQ